MAEIALQNISKVYPGGVRAVDCLNLSIRAGEFMVLIGPSGCGKSTTLRMIAGLEEPSVGEIRVGDRPVNGVAPRERDVAMVFQNYALYPHMSVYGNLAFGLEMRRRRAATGWPLAWIFSAEARRRERAERLALRDAVTETARLLGIESLLRRRPRTLSGGERQRVAVGRALVRRPRAFLFDEPFSNLDARLRLELRAELKRLQRQLATTTLFVTHDQEEALTLGDRLAVMRHGTLQQCGSPQEIYERPVNRFVAGFIGSPPMKFVSGRLVSSAGGLMFESAALRVGLGQRPALGRQAQQPVVAGIRPEAIAPAANGPLTARIELIQPLGERVDLHLDAGGERLICRTNARPDLREGSSMSFEIEASRMHFFAADTEGRNLDHA